MRQWLVVLAAVCACGGGGRAAGGGSTTTPARPATTAERMLALLPEGAQVVVELDLARLRANPVVGELATHALGQLGADAHLPGLPVAVQGSPLANAELVVLAAYGVGTAQAATLTLLATHEEVPNATRLSPEFVALGPPEWIRQVEARAGIAAHSTLAPTIDLMKLRDHAMPPRAPGATVRITARLPFDARVALSRQLGIDSPPAQVSAWGDVVDDMAMIVDCDAADPGDRKNGDAAKRLATTISNLLETVAREPAIRALGLPNNLAQAHMVTQGTWVRTIVEVGPRQLARVVERARALLGK